MWIKSHLKVAGYVGRRQFDEAIGALSRQLTHTDSDLSDLEMIALCHQWAGRDEQAICYARRALAIDAKSFGALSLLGEIYAVRSEHEAAALYTRLALQNFPEPLPPVPKGFMRVLGLIGRVIPRVRVAARDLEGLTSDPGAVHREWYEWAARYLRWYDKAHGKAVCQTVH